MAPNPDPRRTWPHDLEAEAAVLGGCLLRPEEPIAGWLQLEAQHFFAPQHRVVWQALEALAKRGDPADIVTIEAEICAGVHGDRMLDSIGGLSFLGELALKVPTAEHVEHYAAIVRRHWVSRRVLEEAGVIVEQLLRGGEQGEALRDELIARLARIDSEGDRAIPTLADGVAELQERIRRGQTDDLRMVETGIPGLRVPLGKLTALGARPGTGKTALLLWIARGIVLGTGRDAVLAVWEDDLLTLSQRVLADLAGVDGALLGRFTEDLFDRERVLGVGRDDVAARIHVLDCSGRGWRYAERAIRALHRRRPLAFIGVDYLQRIRPHHELRSSKPIEQTKAIVDDADALAHEIDAALIMASQFTRAMEREKREPTVADFRDAPALEQVAKLALLVWELARLEGGQKRIRIAAEKANENVAGGGLDLILDGPHQRFYLAPESEPRPVHGGD